VTYSVRLEKDAIEQLVAIEAYVAAEADPLTAAGFVDRILDTCAGLRVFPYRGRARDDVWDGLRITGYRKRVTIAFTVDEATKTVGVVGIFYGGQDWEARLRNRTVSK